MPIVIGSFFCYPARMPRNDGRSASTLRPIRITPNYVRHPGGSTLIEWGDTRVICTASLEESVPPFLRDSGRGWVTAEYGMLPGSSQPRITRESSRGKVGGRTHEIQRLIGRSLRAVIDLTRVGQRTVWIDCDVIQADGGTRTASITGAYVALVIALRKLLKAGVIAEDPITGAVAAVSAGIVGGESVLDLCYEEDSRADVDMNFVMTGRGEFIEVQGTAEGQPFNRVQLDQLTDLAAAGVTELLSLQQNAIAAAAGL